MSGSEENDSPWRGVWSAVHCPQCNGLHYASACPVCGHVLDLSPTLVEVNGAKIVLPAAMQGAIPYPAHVLLRHMRREWERPVAEIPEGTLREPGERLAVVILFWTLFEFLMDRFYAAAFADLPGELGEELLQRFPGIGGRLDRLYRRRWGTTFWVDLSDLGYADEAKHLQAVQAARNAFIHGDPEAIGDALIADTVRHLRRTQLGWIDVFNRRCTGMNNKVPLWQEDLKRLRHKST